MGYEIETLSEYDEWFAGQKVKFQAQVLSRLQRIKEAGHFGTVNSRLKVDGKAVKGLAELKFNNGGRIYFTVSTGARGETVFLLLGGGKNGQSKDIKKAARLLSELFE